MTKREEYLELVVTDRMGRHLESVLVVRGRDEDLQKARTREQLRLMSKHPGMYIFCNS